MPRIPAFLRRRPPSSAEPAAPRVPGGPERTRAYVVGDVHGCLAQLDALAAQIAADLRGAPAARAFVVLLGDLIDRGPDSAGVVARARAGLVPGTTQVTLLGNHEEMLLRILDGEAALLPDWLSFGGSACVRSYGVDPTRLLGLPVAQGAAVLAKAVPAADLDFLAAAQDSFRLGDFLCVHAGVRPGVPLTAQDPLDLRWIREPFLSSTDDHGLVVVHGHTIVAAPELRANRIALDTGAYAGGPLTALRIDGTDLRFLLAPSLD